jgi:D-tyrosyl-tRNA(Tyr) deacylase
VERTSVRAVVQRVSQAAVEVSDKVCGSVETGLLVYLGVAHDDAEADATYLAEKVRHLRIFPDDNDRMNLDVVHAGGKVLVVSAFTVQADARRGRRPTFETAAAQDHAIVLYELFCDALSRADVQVERGSFGDYMQVKSVNAGPICILLDSRRVF